MTLRFTFYVLRSYIFYEVLIRPQFTQPIITNAKMMGQFVFDSALHSLNHFLAGAANLFNWALKNSDFVGQNQAITAGSPGKGHALVQPQ